ncbi:MAG: virulence RhuM family protein [Desulfovibrio sp.]|jgi:hypothetical protein|nr:virulence RhuM family protein [Desulfovibrio sp.]
MAQKNYKIRYAVCRAVRFRVWANQIVQQYTIKGWVMDGERLKEDGTVLTEKYFPGGRRAATLPWTS